MPVKRKNACQFQSKGTIFSTRRIAYAGGNIHCLPKARQNILQKLFLLALRHEKDLKCLIRISSYSFWNKFEDKLTLPLSLAHIVTGTVKWIL